ncbi:MAG: hypothetical protein ABIH78_05035, partial [Candidatus Peregrinibacteria bacterium]
MTDGLDTVNLKDAFAHLDTSAEGSVDAFAIDLGVCETYPGVVDDLANGIHGAVTQVMNGACIVVLVPKKVPGCENEIAGSTLKTREAMVIAYGDSKNGDTTRYDLVKGKMLYDASKGVCGQYPGAAVSVLGFELDPKSDVGKNMFQAEIGSMEMGGVAKVYLWEGEGNIVAVDGHVVTALVKNGGVVMNRGGEIISTFGEQPEFIGDINGEDNDDGDDVSNTQYLVGTGCNSFPVGLKTIDFTALPPIVLLIMKFIGMIRGKVRAELRKSTGSAKNEEAATAPVSAENIKNAPNKVSPTPEAQDRINARK